MTVAFSEWRGPSWQCVRVNTTLGPVRRGWLCAQPSCRSVGQEREANSTFWNGVQVRSSHRTLNYALLAAGITTALVVTAADKPTKSVPTLPQAFESYKSAIGTLDASKMKDLFLPPDDSVDGRHRKAHLEELERDWAKAREAGSRIRLSFSDTRYIVRTKMLFPAEENESAESELVELQMVLTDQGWRIARMDYKSD